VSLGAILLGCAQAPDHERERRELLRLHDQQRVAHLREEPGLLVSMLADDFTSVVDGRITHPSRDESRRDLERYFASVSVREWEDVSPPTIAFSRDGSLATVIVQKRVRLVDDGSSPPASSDGDTATAAHPTRPAGPAGPADTAAGASGIVREATLAWQETWRKRDGHWALTTVVSTNEPERAIGAATAAHPLPMPVATPAAAAPARPPRSGVAPDGGR
jgi:hypothetical protein